MKAAIAKATTGPRGRGTPVSDQAISYANEAAANQAKVVTLRFNIDAGWPAGGLQPTPRKSSRRPTIRPDSVP